MEAGRRGVRASVVMKTDIRSFTTRLRSLASEELESLLERHQRLVLETAAAHEGVCVKGEGDACWLLFPSVTAAARTASEIHEELRLSQSGSSEEARLSVRIVIAVGDVLHHDGDIFGEAVNLVARIETVTPADETYLSEAAWLCLNRGEVDGEAVGSHSFAGFPEPQRLYRLIQTHATRVLDHPGIVVTDLRGFSRFVEQHATRDVEHLLLRLDALFTAACREHGGAVRTVIGDGYLMSFPDERCALAAADRVARTWRELRAEGAVPCPMLIGVHVGTLYLFRSFLYGPGVNHAARLCGAGRGVAGTDAATVIVSAAARDRLQGTPWEARLVPANLPPECERTLYVTLEEPGSPRRAVEPLPYRLLAPADGPGGD